MLRLGPGAHRTTSRNLLLAQKFLENLTEVVQYGRTCVQHEADSLVVGHHVPKPVTGQDQERVAARERRHGHLRFRGDPCRLQVGVPQRPTGLRTSVMTIGGYPKRPTPGPSKLLLLAPHDRRRLNIRIPQRPHGVQDDS